MLNYTFLLIALLYITFVPGYMIVELFIPKNKFYLKLPLYFVISILISTYLTFLVSLMFGFNRTSVLVTSFVLFIPFFIIFKRTYADFFKNIKSEFKLILFSLMVYFLFFIPLNQGIFREFQGNIVMSGPNWQDTAMHMSIIESLSQGNFPPVAPYFAGEKLTYYYFADLHSAIANVMFSDFLPQILVILNPLLATVMFLSVYALSRYISSSKKFAIISGLMAVFYSNLGFVEVIKDVINKKENYFNLLINNGYHLNHETTLLMVPMADYFLQNRPMMVGLPSFIVVCMLIFLSQKKNNIKILFLSGIVNALLLKFQFFGFLIGIMFFSFSSFYNLTSKGDKFKNILKRFLVFIVPSLFLLFIFGLSKVGSRSLFEVVSETFSFEGLYKKGLLWNLSFIVTNFNLPIFTFFALPFFYNKISKVTKNNYPKVIYFFTFIILAIPFAIKFTIYDYDMFKFFYYAVPLVAIVFGHISYLIHKHNKGYIAVSIFVLIFTALTSLNLLTHAYLNKSVAYSVLEYQVGKWVRENTPKKSVFLTYPSVHSGVSDVAGRIRVLSYINWPYSHGFNVGQDNVFSRVEDINTFYSDPENNKNVLDKYNVDYVYFGSEERSNFPESENKLESTKFLEKVYDWEESIKIYRTE